jgi:hypothetical protein
VGEVLINLVPVLLGDGERLFQDLGGRVPELEPLSTIAAPWVMHLKFRVKHPA